MNNTPPTSDPWEAGPERPARFILVPHFIYETLSKNELAVYLSLAYHSDEHGYSWPSQATIANESGLSIATVKRALGELLKRDGFRKEKRAKVGGPNANAYFIPLRKPH